MEVTYERVDEFYVPLVDHLLVFSVGDNRVDINRDNVVKGSHCSIEDFQCWSMDHVILVDDSLAVSHCSKEELDERKLLNDADEGVTWQTKYFK